MVRVRLRVRHTFTIAAYILLCFVIAADVTVKGVYAHGGEGDDDDDAPLVTISLPPIRFDTKAPTLWPRPIAVAAANVAPAAVYTAGTAFDLAVGTPLVGINGDVSVHDGNSDRLGFESANFTAVSLRTLPRTTIRRGRIVVTQTLPSPLSSKSTSITDALSDSDGTYTITVALRPLASAAVGEYVAVGGVTLIDADAVSGVASDVGNGDTGDVSDNPVSGGSGNDVPKDGGSGNRSVLNVLAYRTPVGFQLLPSVAAASLQRGHGVVGANAITRIVLHGTPPCKAYTVCDFSAQITVAGVTYTLPLQEGTIDSSGGGSGGGGCGGGDSSASSVRAATTLTWDLSHCPGVASDGSRLSALALRASAWRFDYFHTMRTVRIGDGISDAGSGGGDGLAGSGSKGGCGTQVACPLCPLDGGGGNGGITAPIAFLFGALTVGVLLVMGRIMFVNLARSRAPLQQARDALRSECSRSGSSIRQLSAFGGVHPGVSDADGSGNDGQ